MCRTAIRNAIRGCRTCSIPIKNVPVNSKMIAIKSTEASGSETESLEIDDNDNLFTQTSSASDV